MENENGDEINIEENIKKYILPLDNFYAYEVEEDEEGV